MNYTKKVEVFHSKFERPHPEKLSILNRKALIAQQKYLIEEALEKVYALVEDQINTTYAPSIIASTVGNIQNLEKQLNGNLDTLTEFITDKEGTEEQIHACIDADCDVMYVLQGGIMAMGGDSVGNKKGESVFDIGFDAICEANNQKIKLPNVAKIGKPAPEIWSKIKQKQEDVISEAIKFNKEIK